MQRNSCASLGRSVTNRQSPRHAQPCIGKTNTLGRNPRDLRHLTFTHGHPDHIGSAAAIVQETGATTYMHALDAPFAETGGPFRPMNPAPGLLPRTAYRFVWRPQKRMEPVRIDRYIADG